MSGEQNIGKTDRRVVRNAFDTLENLSLPIRVANALGRPVESAAVKLREIAPDMGSVVDDATRKALDIAMQGALKTLRAEGHEPARPKLHAAAAAATGAVGGFLGAPGLLVELPITTGIIFRSIANTARAEGADLSSPATVVECMNVFAFGSEVNTSDDAADTAYYGTRILLGKATTDAAAYIARAGLSGSPSAPAIVRLVSLLASRFGIVVSQKTALQLVPVVGAVGGGLINSVFINHYQDVAQAHFSLARLERKYGTAPVRNAYEACRDDAI